MSNPTVFGDDVVDNVDDVLASHVNNLRAWHSVFAPLICNMESVSTTDTTYTLSDTDKPFIVFAAVGSTDFIVYLPVESTDNHPFWIGNGTTDYSAYTITIKNSSSDQIGTALDGLQYYKIREWIPTGTDWLTTF